MASAAVGSPAETRSAWLVAKGCAVSRAPRGRAPLSGGPTAVRSPASAGSSRRGRRSGHDTREDHRAHAEIRRRAAREQAQSERARPALRSVDTVSSADRLTGDHGSLSRAGGTSGGTLRAPRLLEDGRCREKEPRRIVGFSEVSRRFERGGPVSGRRAEASLSPSGRSRWAGGGGSQAARTRRRRPMSRGSRWCCPSPESRLGRRRRERACRRGRRRAPGGALS
jgi:hypothetical protein